VGRLKYIVLSLVLLLVGIGVGGSHWGIPAACDAVTSATSPRLRLNQCSANYLLTRVTASSARVTLPKIPITLVLKSPTLNINWLQSLLTQRLFGEGTAALLGGTLRVAGSGTRSSFFGSASLQNSFFLEIPMFSMLGFTGGSISASFPTLEFSPERISGYGTLNLVKVVASSSPLTLGIPLTNTNATTSISLGSHGIEFSDIEISDERLGALRGKITLTSSSFPVNFATANISGTIALTLTALGREKIAPLLGISELAEGPLQGTFSGTLNDPTVRFEPGI
jgi:hypothetical protein